MLSIYVQRLHVTSTIYATYVLGRLNFLAFLHSLLLRQNHGWDQGRLNISTLEGSSTAIHTRSTMQSSIIILYSSIEHGPRYVMYTDRQVA